MKILTLSANGAYFENASIMVNGSTNNLTCYFDVESTVTKSQIKNAFGGNDIANLYRLTLNSVEADSDDDYEEFIGFTRLVSIDTVEDEDNDDIKHCTVVLRRPNLNELIVDVYSRLEIMSGETENLMMATGGSYADLSSDIIQVTMTQLEIGGK